MSVNRIDRVNGLLRREIAEALYKVFVGVPDIDLAVITVTRVQCAPNLRNAMVWLSFFEHEQDRGRWLRMIADKASELQKLINSNMTLKYTPCLRFAMDDGVEKGDHVLGVLMQMEMSGALPPAPPPGFDPVFPDDDDGDPDED